MNELGPIGSVKFVLLHHGACRRSRFHFRIQSDGTIDCLLSTALRGQHPQSIGVVLAGDFDQSEPNPEQIVTLKQLLLDLKRQYPAFRLGAHRNVRGSAAVTCPGHNFPLRDILAWSKSDLLQLRAADIQLDIESQYGP